MADPENKRGAPPSEIRVEKKKTNWLLWALLALALLALLLALSRCNRKEEVVVTPAPVVEAQAVPPVAPVMPAAPVMAGISTLEAFLAGTDPAPRSFIFEKLNFETAKSEIRAADRAEIEAIAATLAQHPTARIRLDGYADARGESPTNAALGKARADSVKAALVAKGVAAERIETATGGETNPVDTNATASGQAENRRTELVVTQR